MGTGHEMKISEIILIITTIGGILFGVMERWEKIEQAKNHDHVVSEIAEAAQTTAEMMR